MPDSLGVRGRGVKSLRGHGFDAAVAASATQCRASNHEGASPTPTGINPKSGFGIHLLGAGSRVACHERGDRRRNGLGRCGRCGWGVGPVALARRRGRKQIPDGSVALLLRRHCRNHVRSQLYQGWCACAVRRRGGRNQTVVKVVTAVRLRRSFVAAVETTEPTNEAPIYYLSSAFPATEPTASGAGERSDAEERVRTHAYASYSLNTLCRQVC